MDRTRTRSGSLDTRAGLLISSTAIASSLQLTGEIGSDPEPITAAAGIAALVAIGFGVAVLRTVVGSELDHLVLRKRIVSGGNPPYVDMFWVGDKYFQHVLKAEAIIARKAKLLNAGFLGLAASVVLSMIP
ncbi:hypothetical protein [Leucobacter japonicus]|uniref:hypothetical protein n=1 Tax=Leucobacter japonicus TaxID=1461259 RepID=UPI000B0D6D46|nr:hypothetical protein [Leucobacter japonicus]